MKFIMVRINYKNDKNLKICIESTLRENNSTNILSMTSLFSNK